MGSSITGSVSAVDCSPCRLNGAHRFLLGGRAVTAPLVHQHQLQTQWMYLMTLLKPKIRNGATMPWCSILAEC